jgi:hypothetical protein
MKFGEIVSFKHKKKGNRTVLFIEENEEKLVGLALPEDEDLRNEILSVVNEQMLKEYSNDEQILNLVLSRQEEIKRRREALEIFSGKQYRRSNKKDIMKIMEKLVVSYSKDEIK